MIGLQNDEFLVSASSLEATFSDGVSLQDPNVNLTIHPGTTLGDEIWIQGTAPEHESYIIRLVIIPPDRDWRQSASYAWKLDSAWMSAVSPEATTYSWLHWNVESYVDSAIQADDSNEILECDELELHFRPIREDSTSRYPYTTAPMIPNERLILRGLRLGLHRSAAPRNASSTTTTTTCMSPCASTSQPCIVVDGAVQEGGMQRERDIPHENEGGRNARILEAGAAVAATLALLFLTVEYCRRYHRSKHYKQLRPTPDEDTTLRTLHSPFPVVGAKR
jgi:hypothetical protein